MALLKNMFSGGLRDMYDKARQLVTDPSAPAPSSQPAPAVELEILPMIPADLPPPKSIMRPEHLEEMALLLAPITEDEPCGPAMRYDPVFTEIRLAREEDDPALPMRQWERPLKRADWPLIESRCKLMLGTRSKDLQIAAWLLETWTRQDAFEGLYRGLALIDGLLRQYWIPLHPVVDEDGDCDARIAPLTWINESIAMTVKVHVPLLHLAGHKPPKLTFADWERMTAKELAGPDHSVDTNAAGDVEAPLTRDYLVAYAMQHLAADVEYKLELVQSCLRSLTSIMAFVDEQLGMDSPNFSKLISTLEAIERVLKQLTPEQKGPDMPVEIKQTIDVTQARVDNVIAPLMAPVVTSGNWANRHDAYQTLEAIADYLSLVEPHSPTPYLLRRAVNWGRMPLPELMAEIIREEGDLNRLMNVLGLKE